MISATVSSIRSDDPASWSGKLFLTIDVDWAHDDVILDTIDLLEAEGVSATWFVTHDSPVLAHLRRNPQFELGIHPNFNWLLAGDPRNGKDAREVVSRMMDLVPDAKCVRSHSMTQSSYLLDVFSSAGLTHDVNHFVPASVGAELRPWTLWNGMTRVPYFWEDDIACIYEAKGIMEPTVFDAARTGTGVKVFDFHPIHVFLNTEDLERYERTRQLHRAPRELLQERHPGYGARSRLQELLVGLKSGGSNGTTG
jgi:hypothetical protein